MLLYCCQSLLITFSKQGDGYAYNPNTSVLMSEFCKFLLASTFLFIERRAGGADAGSVAGFSLRSSLRYSVPALLYAVHNNIVFIALELIDPPTYQLFNSIKIITTGIVFRFVLRRQLTLLQWLGLSLLTLGVTTTQLGAVGGGAAADCGEGAAAAAEEKANHVFAGFLYMVFLSSLSALAGVYNEYLIKGSADSVNFQNMQMYFYSVIVCVAGNVFSGSGGEVQDDDQGWFDGFGAVAWLIVIVNAFLGQAVGFIFKYADNIVKVYATSASIALTALLSTWFFDFVPTPQLYVGMTVATLSFFLYFAKPETLAQKDVQLLSGASAGRSLSV